MGKTLDITAIPVSGIDHPPPPDQILPRHEFSMGFIAPKGSGKTTALIRMVSFYKGFFHTIIVISPTVNNDEKWEWFKKQPLLGENKKLKKCIIKLKNQAARTTGIVERQGVTDEFDKYLKPFDPIIPADCFVTEYSPEVIVSIREEQQELVELLKKHGYTKHVANRVLLIFDDLVGSDLFTEKKKDPFKMLNTNHRHGSFSLLLVSQAYKEIPRTIRTQFSCLVIFEIPNEEEVKAIYSENPMHLKLAPWKQLYEYAVEGDHNFMFINYQAPKRLRIMKNFKQYLYWKASDKVDLSKEGMHSPSESKEVQDDHSTKHRKRKTLKNHSLPNKK